MGEDKVEISQEFLSQLIKDPQLINKLKRQDEKEKFLSKYGVKRATPFKCPACTSYLQSGGTLWGPMEGYNDRYVCRKCELVWDVQCVTRPNDDIALKIREIKKGKPNELIGESQSQTVEGSQPEGEG
jgi:transposase-like protein